MIRQKKRSGTILSSNKKSKKNNRQPSTSNRDQDLNDSLQGDTNVLYDSSVDQHSVVNIHEYNISEMKDLPSSSSSSLDMTSSTSKSVAVPLVLPPYTWDFGEYFCEQYTVVKLILSHLNYFDLNTLREVNAALKAAADNSLKRRNWIQYISLNYLPPHPEPIYSGHYIDLRIEPEVLFTFECMEDYYFPRSKPNLSNLLRDRRFHFPPRYDIVPKSVKTFVPIGVKGIIYPEKDHENQVIKVSNVNNKLVLLYMPKFDNYDIEVHTHLVKEEMFEEESIRKLFKCDHRPIRGIIILKSGSSFNYYMAQLMKFIERLITVNQSVPYAVSGGHVTSLEYENPQKKTIIGVVKIIIFRGDGIRCASDFISSTDNDGVIEELKETSFLVDKTFEKLNEKKSLIIMFQNQPRNENQIKDYTHISNTFPNIPIFGLLTRGEVGFRSFNQNELQLAPKKRVMSTNTTYETTFMIISFD